MLSLRPRRRRVCALVLVALLVPGTAWAALPGVPGATAGPWGVWRVETVDVGDVSHGPSIAIDSAGRAHVAYDTTHETITYALQNGQSWQKTVLGTGIYANIALDAQARPHVTWAKRNPGDFDLYYAYYNGSAWTVEVADAVGYTGLYNDVAVDAQGRVHVVYYKDNVGLMYALRTSSGWQNELVDSDASSWSGLDVDSQGNPHVAYAAHGGNGWGRVKYATRDAAGWSIQQIDERGGVEIDIAIDSQDRPHMSYRDEGETLGYAHHNGTAWIFEVADWDAPTGAYTAIDTDSQNRPHIAYWQVFNRGNTNDPLRAHLKYATKLDTGDWATEFVEPTGRADMPAIAIDENDRPRVAYVYVRDQVPVNIRFDLKYAEPVPATLARSVEGVAS